MTKQTNRFKTGVTSGVKGDHCYVNAISMIFVEDDK